MPLKFLKFLKFAIEVFIEFLRKHAPIKKQVLRRNVNTFMAEATKI